MTNGNNSDGSCINFKSEMLADSDHPFGIFKLVFLYNRKSFEK